MSAPAISVTLDATFADVVEVLLTHGISGVPVVDDDGVVVGVVTQADLVSHEAYGENPRSPLALIGNYLRGHDPQWVRKASGQRAATLMTGAVDTTTPDANIADAARRMLEAKHRRLPVVEDGRLVGIVTMRDILSVL